MLTRSIHLFREQVAPVALLFAALAVTVGWIGLLGYGILALVGFGY